MECALCREGNGWSHDYCRRQWSLADADHLRYRYMNAWDATMQRLDEEYCFLSSSHLMVSYSGDKEQVCMHAMMFPQEPSLEAVSLGDRMLSPSATDWCLPQSLPAARTHDVITSTPREPLAAGVELGSA